ncbi:cell division protein FtsZ [Fluviispira multicolorata]|uniref:Cell division protein FtsZ n=1 Tax=Fluviispira multicolorata TaxID=2654512 RepID=A0A833N5L3_9BACT|nr:cell division protein FtsZ [Fluviispira multicolorata]KAB8030877.1 cell division protein FtsZ [Fluviispira multicolorata]
MNEKSDKGNKYSSNAIIKVIGVGGGGGNALNTMIESGLSGVEFIAANTDVQALQSNLAPIKIQLGRELTKGLGAGANPETGRNAALEDKAILQEVLSGADMVFVTGGMGGGTGTGAAPIIAQVARELGALTVGVVTKPFTFEGKRRKQQSEHGIQSLRQSVDTLITIPNQRLLSIASPEMSMLDGFKLADEVLLNAVKGISDIINIPGRVNVDFADVKTIMSEMGMALMGIGDATGPNRAAEAARLAINSPLLEDIDIEGATGILINITGTSTMTLHEISEASTLIQEAAHEDANIIFGAVIDENMEDRIRVTVIATGFDQARVAFPESAHGFANIPQQNQFMQTNVNSQPQQAIPQQPFAGMNSQRPQNNFTQNIPAVNPYDVRNQAQNIQQQPISQNQFNQNSQPPNHFPRPQYGREPQSGFGGNSGLNAQSQHMNRQSPELNNNHNNINSGFRNIPQPEIRNTTQQQHHQPAAKNQETQTNLNWNTPKPVHSNENHQNNSQAQNSVSKNENATELEDLTKWTFDMANQQQNANRDSKVVGATSNKSEELLQEDAAESALKLAKELSDIEIDDSDFETPAFMRRKDDSHRNA